MNRIGDHARNFLNSIALHRERDDSVSMLIYLYCILRLMRLERTPAHFCSPLPGGSFV